LDVKAIRRKLVLWYERNRRDLPWRRTRDPYAILVSEVMLQQTRVAAVIPYYERFLERFPRAEDLARANEAEVLALWSGLGYYSRARNLQKAARQMVDTGGFPRDYASIRELAGAGDYTAAAVASIAFGLPHAAVDGNVRRVIQRLAGSAAVDIGAAAEALLDRRHPGRWNQALMELGATVCSFKSPRCLICPMQSACVAFRTGMQDRIPPVKKRPATVHVHLFAVVHKKRDRYLMKPVDGMWEFPMFSELPVGAFEKIGSCRHTITHHRLDVSVYEGKLVEKPYEWKEPEQLPISALTRKILKAAANRSRVAAKQF